MLEKTFFFLFFLTRRRRKKKKEEGINRCLSVEKEEIEKIKEHWRRHFFFLSLLEAKKNNIEREVKAEEETNRYFFPIGKTGKNKENDIKKTSAKNV